MVKYRIAYLWISPFFILFAIFGVYPVFYSFFLAFHRWPGYGEWKWIGLQNIVLLFTQDDHFWTVLWNTLFLWIVIVPLRTFLSLTLASVFNSSEVRGKEIFRVLYILPFVTSSIVVGIIFRVLLETKGGWVNVATGLFGIPAVNWLRDVRWSKVSVAIVMMWRSLGYFMIIMLAGLQRIPRDLYEAATIDGASVVQSFLRITVPLMKPIVTFVMVISTIQVLQAFEVPYVMTQGGPRYSSTTMTYQLWLEAFQYTRLGYGSAIALILFVVIVATSLVQYRSLERGE
jgi:ABC-type sugar transport system permease subunit